MARVYQSRGLIDPSMYQLMSNNMNERIRQDRESRRPVVEMLQGAVTTLGSAYDDWSKQKGRDRYLKRVLEDNPEFAKYKDNPFFKAGMHEFVRTGESSPLMSFLSAERAAEEKADTKKWHDAVRAEQARERYAKNLELYNSADTEAKKQQYLLANQALEAEFDNIFGQQMEDYAKAAAADEVAARQLAYELDQDKKEKEAKERQSDSTKYWIQQNIMPTGSVKGEGYKGKDGKWHTTKSAETVRGEIAEFINRNPDLNDSDKKELLDKLFGNKTQSELNQNARDSAVATGEGQKVTTSLEDKTKADSAWGKLKEGRAIFGDEESVFLKVYGNDKDKMAKYHAVND